MKYALSIHTFRTNKHRLTKRLLLLFASVLLLTGLGACKGSKDAAKNKDAKHALKIKTVKNFVKPENHRDVTIEDWSIEDDVAKLIINYSGGCGKHTFSAYFDGNFMKSLPPKANVFLQHDHTEDNCRKLIIDTLYVNLTEMRYDKTKPGTVILGFNGSDKTLEYTYK